MKEHDILVSQVKAFAADPDSDANDMLESLLVLDREDLLGQASIRYLMRTGAWRYERTGNFHAAINHLFAHFTERVPVEPLAYQEATKAIIQEKWGYECIPIEIKVVERPVVDSKKSVTKPVARRGVRTTATEEASLVSGSKTFQSINKSNEIDTDGASSRLKKVIEIQRNG